MPPKSLRRSRALDSEDEEPVRSGTPVSTAPNDGKRARRTLNQDRDPSSPDTVDQASDNEDQPPRERKPVITNGPLTNKPKHQPGAIVRIKLTNFVTYTSAEFFPGPNLNMVIGPNGTGKSTLVCAICLGLGWSTQYLGRAKDAAEFVKHGCREAIIEIELQRSLRGKNATRTNPIITRTIKREGNKSTFTLDGTVAPAKVVVQVAKSYDIQIDNLCQFLPQDKVVEFAQMTPIEILQSTQRAAAPPYMLELHEDLKNLRKSQKESNDTNKNDREALANLGNRQEMQRTEVERLRERVVVQKRLGWLKKCKPIPQYTEAKARAKQAKDIQNALRAELAQLKAENEPIMNKIKAKEAYALNVKNHKLEREKAMADAEKGCNQLAVEIEKCETRMRECDIVEASVKKSVQPNREELNRTRVRISTMKKQKDQAPEPFDSRAMNEEIQERVVRAREAGARVEDIQARASTIKQQGSALHKERKQCRETLNALDTDIGKQEDLLKSRSIDSYRAWKWIQDNRDKFKMQVFGPPMIECTLKDPSMASSIEAVLQQNDFRVFTVQCREDFMMLQQELTSKQRMHDISLRTCPFDSLERFRPPMSSEQMQDFGLKGWAIDLLEGPGPVLAMLCQEKFLHQTAMTDTDITQAQHDRLGSIPSVKSYVTKTKSYQFIRRAEFGAAGITARERSLRPASIWTNRPVDSVRKHELETKIRDIEVDIEEIRAQLPLLGAENNEALAEKNTLESEIKELRAEKEEKQKALAEYNGLDIKINQAEEKAARLVHNLETVKTNLDENRKQKDEAMFEKAEAVLKYCSAIHVLQAATKAAIEVGVMFIEAENDSKVLSQRSQGLKDMLKKKTEQRDQAVAEAAREHNRAKQLMNEIKDLRDEGIALEEKENDRGLTTLLEELSSDPTGTVQNLDGLIDVEQAKLELTEGGDMNAIKDFEEREKRIEQLRSKLNKMSSRQRDLLAAIKEVREKWEAPLEALVAKISDAFGESFARIGCAGQVSVHKASSDDAVDCTDELGGSENGLDFANWAIHISVKFRQNEGLSLLDSHRQSGGERAVSTIFYLMALQSLSRAPFRVVDEINQGMDPRNERMVHGRMVDMAAADADGKGQGSQYFLITPKLLSGLKYKAGMTVLCIVSGENIPSASDVRTRNEDGQWVTHAGKKIDFGEFARKARALGLGQGAGKAIDSGVSMGSSMDEFGFTGRSRGQAAEVGA